MNADRFSAPAPIAHARPLCGDSSDMNADARIIQSFDDPRVDALRIKVRDYIRDVVMTNGDKWEAEGTINHDEFRRLGAMGLLGLSHPIEFGGTDLGPIASVVFAEEISRCTYSGLPEAVLIHTDMASTHIACRGADEQKLRYLPGMISGDLICCVAVTEPDSGSDVAGLATTARRTPEGWVLNGVKSYVTNALHGDVFVVAARTDPHAKSSRAISLFAVERDCAGLTIRPMAPKHGMLSSDIAELVFTDAALPAGSLIGEENKGFYGVMENFQNERLILGAMSLGMGLQALDLTLAYLKSRKAFGGVLWDRQAIRHRIAFLYARMQAVGALVYDTARQRARGEACVREVSMVKALAGETLQDVVRGCLQVHGGYGYMRGAAIERLGRDARLLTIGGGATEVMLDEVAKRL
jgi:acyl-CoA dehydrogenase